MEQLINKLIAENEIDSSAFFVIEEYIINDALKYKVSYISDNIKKAFKDIIYIGELQNQFPNYYSDFLETFNEAAKSKSSKSMQISINNNDLELSIKSFDKPDSMRVFICDIQNFDSLIDNEKELGLFVEYIKYHNDDELSIFETSSIFAKLLAYDEYNGKSLYSFLEGDNYKLALKELTKLSLIDGKTINTELNFVSNNGEIISLHIISEYIKNDDYWNAILMPLSTNSNIVDMITNSSPIGVVAFDIDSKEILYKNTYAYEILTKNNWIENDESYFKHINNDFYAIVLKANSKDDNTLIVKLRDGTEIYSIFSKLMVFGSKNINILYITNITNSYNDAKKESERSQQLEDLINNSPGAVCLFKWDGGTVKPVVIGEVFIELLGVPYEKIMENNISAFFKAVHPEELFAFTTEIRRMLYETKSLHGVFRLFNFSEEKYHSVLIDARCVPQKDGTQFINSCFTDVSDEIEKSNLLSEASSKIKLLYEHIPGAIFSCKIDSNWSLIYANEEFYSFLGYNESSFRKMYGTKLLSLMFEEESKKLSEAAISRMKSHSKTHILMEMRLKTTLGIKWVSLSGEVLEDEDSIPYCYFVFVDITEFKQNQIKQEKEHTMLTELLAALPCGMIVFEPNEDPKINFVNDIASEILGYENKTNMLNNNSYLYSYISNESKETIKNFNKSSKNIEDLFFINNEGTEIKTKSSLYLSDNEDGKEMVYLIFYKYF